MNYIQIVGGIKAEVKSEIKSEEQVDVVEIGPKDILNNNSDLDDDEGNFQEKLQIDQLENVEFKIKPEVAKETTQDISSNIGKQVIYEDQNSRNLEDKKNLKIEEKLLLNYTENEDLLDDSSMKKLPEMRDKVNRKISWSKVYRTFEGTPLKEDCVKIKRNIVPVSFVSPSEYTEEDINKLRCTHCQFISNTKRNIIRHIRLRHRVATKTYGCPYCPYKSKYYPQAHIVSMHKPESELTWFRCNQCDYKSKLKTTLIVHLNSHLDPTQMIDRMKKCDKCPKMFKTQHSLGRHILNVHERQLKCLECEYKSSLPEKLRHHIDSCHADFEDLKTRQCPKCTFKTKIKKKFESHMSLNHGGTIQCEKYSNQAKSTGETKLHLINHKEIKDDADLKYRCDKCDYKTYRMYSLQIHNLSHLKPTEIRYFYCYHCSFKTKEKYSLKVHLLRHLKQNEAIASFNKQLLEKVKPTSTAPTEKTAVDTLDKNNRNLGDQKSLQTEEKLLLIKEETPLNEDKAKIKSNSVPISFVSPTEYTQEDNKFRCTYCQFVTNAKRNMTRHIRCRHRGETKTYECPYCPYKSKSYPTFHIVTMHKPESELTWFRCNQCDYKSKFKSALTQHIATHLDPIEMIDRMKKCDRCPKMFKTAYSLNRHILFSHERHKIKNLKCQECEYTSPLPEQLNHHVQLYHSNFEDLKTLQCPKCTFNTKIKRRLIAHMSVNHRGKFQCEKCPHQAKSMEKMKLHLITHKEIKDDDDLKYRCDKCVYKTSRSYNLQLHKLNHLKPEEIQYFYCYHCSFKAKVKSNLKQHLVKHFRQSEVTLACYLCDFTTKKRHLLVGHVDNHSKEINMGNEVSVSVKEASKEKKNINSKRSSTQQSRKRKHISKASPSKVKQSQQTEILKTEAIASVDKQSLEEVINPKVEPTSTPPTDQSVNESKKLKVECLEGNEKLKFEFIPVDSSLLKLKEEKTE